MDTMFFLISGFTFVIHICQAPPMLLQSLLLRAFKHENSPAKLTFFLLGGFRLSIFYYRRATLLCNLHYFCRMDFVFSMSKSPFGRLRIT